MGDQVLHGTRSSSWRMLSVSAAETAEASAMDDLELILLNCEMGAVCDLLKEVIHLADRGLDSNDRDDQRLCVRCHCRLDIWKPDASREAVN